MTYLFTDYENRLRSNLLADATGAEDHWGNARIDPIINRARRWLQGELLEAFDSQWDIDVELSVASGKIALPAGFIMEKAFYRGELADPTRWVAAVIRHATSARRRIFQAAVTWNDEPQVAAETWVIVGEELKPRFQAPTDGTTYVLTYAKELTDLSGSGADPLPDRFCDIALMKATAEAAKVGGDDRMAQDFEMKANREIQKLKDQAAHRSLSRLEQVEDVMGYGGEDDSLTWTY